MPYTPVTWAAGELFTSTKANQMVANELLNYKDFGEVILNCMTDVLNTNNATDQERWRGQLYIPPGAVERGELTFKFFSYITLGGTGYVTFEIDDDSEEVEVEVTDAALAAKSGTLDISGISAGWKTCYVWMRTNGTGVIYCKGVTVAVSAE